MHEVGSMEREKVKSFLISEYERWFSVTTDELRKSREDDETKAKLLERSREQLAGMLMFIRGTGAITQTEFQTMYEEMRDKLDPHKLYNFRIIMRTEVFHADRD